MARRFSVLVVLITLLAAPTASLLHAQADSTLNIVALESQQTLVEAWIAGYQDASPETVLSVSYVSTTEDALAQAIDAQIVLTNDVEAPPAIAFECGFVSDAYVPVPEWAAWYLASNSCGDTIDPKDAAAKSFADYIVSPDGQEVAITLGLLPETVEIIDQAGMTVSVQQPVRRIAAPYSMATYYVYSVGAGNRLVAASYLGARDEAGQAIMRRIDPNFDVVLNGVSTLNQQETNIEELVGLNPDLTLASARTDWLGAAEEVGLSIIRFEGESPERLQEAMSLLGAVLGPNAAYRAEEFNRYYDDTLDQILAQTESIEPRLKVYFSGTNPLRTAGADMYQAAMVKAAGAEIVTQDLATGFWNDVNLEQVVLWNPDVIFYPPYGGANAEAFLDSPEWAIIPAVQDAQVFGVPKLAAPWDTPVPDSILGIIWMATTMYPEQVSFDCAAEVTKFYNTFYDYAISEGEVENLCQ